MRLSFIFPAALWLLVALVPLWALALIAPRRLSPARFWGSLLLLPLDVAVRRLIYLRSRV